MFIDDYLLNTALYEMCIIISMKTVHEMHHKTSKHDNKDEPMH